MHFLCSSSVYFSAEIQFTRSRPDIPPALVLLLIVHWIFLSRKIVFFNHFRNSSLIRVNYKGTESFKNTLFLCDEWMAFAPIKEPSEPESSLITFTTTSCFVQYFASLCLSLAHVCMMRCVALWIAVRVRMAASVVHMTRNIFFEIKINA